MRLSGGLPCKQDGSSLCASRSRPFHCLVVLVNHGCGHLRAPAGCCGGLFRDLRGRREPRPMCSEKATENDVQEINRQLGKGDARS
jgi:hypothetical protein